MCAISLLVSDILPQADSVRERREKLLKSLEIAEKDFKRTDNLLGEGATGKVYFADCYGFHAAAKVIVCIDGKEVGVVHVVEMISIR